MNTLIKFLDKWITLTNFNASPERYDLKYHYEVGKIVAYIVTLLVPLVSLFTDYWQAWALWSGWIAGVLVGGARELYSLVTRKGTASLDDFMLTSRGAMVGGLQFGMITVLSYIILNLLGTL